MFEDFVPGNSQVPSLAPDAQGKADFSDFAPGGGQVQAPPQPQVPSWAPAQRPWNPFAVENLIEPVETPLAFLSGAFSWPVSKGAGLAAGLFGKAMSEPETFLGPEGVSPERRALAKQYQTDPQTLRSIMEQTEQDAAEIFTYHPRSKASQKAMEQVGGVLHAALTPARKVDELVSKQYGPNAGYLSGFLAELGMFKAAHKAGKGAADLNKEFNQLKDLVNDIRIEPAKAEMYQARMAEIERLGREGESQRAAVEKLTNELEATLTAELESEVGMPYAEFVRNPNIPMPPEPARSVVSGAPSIRQTNLEAKTAVERARALERERANKFPADETAGTTFDPMEFKPAPEAPAPTPVEVVPKASIPAQVPKPTQAAKPSRAKAEARFDQLQNKLYQQLKAGEITKEQFDRRSNKLWEDYVAEFGEGKGKPETPSKIRSELEGESEIKSPSELAANQPKDPIVFGTGGKTISQLNAEQAAIKAGVEFKGGSAKDGYFMFQDPKTGSVTVEKLSDLPKALAETRKKFEAAEVKKLSPRERAMKYAKDSGVVPDEMRFTKDLESSMIIAKELGIENTVRTMIEQGKSIKEISLELRKSEQVKAARKKYGYDIEDLNDAVGAIAIDMGNLTVAQNRALKAGIDQISGEVVAKKYPGVIKLVKRFFPNVETKSKFSLDRKQADIILSRIYDLDIDKLSEISKNPKNYLKELQDFEKFFKLFPRKESKFQVDVIRKAVDRGELTARESEFLTTVLERLKKDPDFEIRFTNKDSYTVSKNLLKVKEPRHFAHEVMHWAFYNALTGKDRIAFVKYMLENESKWGKLSERFSEVAAKEGKLYFDNELDNIGEYFAEQGNAFIHSNVVPKGVLKKLYAKVSKLINTFVDILMNRENQDLNLAPFFEKIIETRKSTGKDIDFFGEGSDPFKVVEAPQATPVVGTAQLGQYLRNKEGQVRMFGSERIANMIRKKIADKSYVVKKDDASGKFFLKEVPKKTRKPKLKAEDLEIPEEVKAETRRPGEMTPEEVAKLPLEDQQAYYNKLLDSEGLSEMRREVVELTRRELEGFASMDKKLKDQGGIEKYLRDQGYTKSQARSVKDAIDIFDSNQKAPETVKRIQMRQPYDEGHNLVRKMEKVGEALSEKDAYSDFHNFLRSAERVADFYEKGSLKPATRIKPVIAKTKPKYSGKDIGVLRQIASPHNVLRRVFPEDSPIVDFLESTMTYATNVLQGKRYAKDIRKSLPDASKDIAKAIEPVQKKLDPLLDQQHEIMTKIEMRTKRVRGMRAGPNREMQKKALENLNKSLRHVRKKIEAELESYDAILADLAKKHPEARVALHLGGQLPEGVKLSFRENEIADSLRSFFDQYKEDFKKTDIPVLEDRPYFTHLWNQLSNDSFMQKTLKTLGRKPPVVMNFKHQLPGSRVWFPSVNAVLKHYLPVAERKLAYQLFLDRWSEFIQAELPRNSRTRKYMMSWMGKNLYPKHTPGSKFLDALVSYEYLRIIGFSASVAFKHLMKLPGTASVTGIVPTAKALPRALAASRAVFRMPKKGQNNEIFRSYVMASHLVRALDETPGLQPMFAAAKSVAGAPTMWIEAFDNGVSVFAGIMKGAKKGLTPEQTHNAIWQTILDTNFRAGPDQPLWQKSSVGRALSMFQMTPFKLAEFKYRLVKDAFSGKKDAFGGSTGAALVRYIALAGIAESLARQNDSSILELFLHPPFLGHLTKTQKDFPYVWPNVEINPKHKWEKEGMFAHTPELVGNPLGDIGRKEVHEIVKEKSPWNMPQIKKAWKTVGKGEYSKHYYNSPWEHFLGIQKVGAGFKKDDSSRRRAGRASRARAKRQ
jgi:hypothetical protein